MVMAPGIKQEEKKGGMNDSLYLATATSELTQQTKTNSLPSIQANTSSHTYVDNLSQIPRLTK